MFELHHGNCRDIMQTMPDSSVDAIVTDPPYGLSFMGKKWDYDVPSVEIWQEAFRVLKPGGHLLAFAGTRTQHRMAVRIEDAGFEIRDMIAWMYGSGFPKSLNISKAFDRSAKVLKAEATAFNVAGTSHNPNISKTVPCKGYMPPDPVTNEAKQWQGWGTALKPAMEPITMARKPFRGSVAENVSLHGTGAINIEACRIGDFIGCDESYHNGRWAANVIHDGSPEVLQSMGEASRFFYTPKACKEDRDDGCETLEYRQTIGGGGTNDPNRDDVCGKYGSVKSMSRNFHPTVKPTDLMRYLCRLVTPPGGTVLDPFTGSGSTGRGAVLEGFRFIGCELDADYVTIAKARILAAEKAYQPCLTFD